MRRKLVCFFLAALAAVALTSSPGVAAKHGRSGSTIIAARDVIRD